MWLLIVYLIGQAILWWAYGGDFSVLAKSSDVFAMISTIDLINDTASLDYVFREFQTLLNKILYYAVMDDISRIKRKFIRKTDRMIGKGLRTLLFTSIALGLKIFS